ncbi:MAG: hypothetical protein ACOC57_03775 [Acidobacteriota bacterium]
MKKRNSIEVLFYEGYKSRETPRALLIGNKEKKIKEILSRSRLEDAESGERSEVFICRFEDGSLVKLFIFESGRIEIAFLEED